MSRVFRIPYLACFALALLVVGASSGCAGRVRVYDEYHSDYHRWDRDEDQAYRRYLNEHHEQYRDYNKLNKDEQKDYWNSRHQEQH